VRSPPTPEPNSPRPAGCCSSRGTTARRRAWRAYGSATRRRASSSGSSYATDLRGKGGGAVLLGAAEAAARALGAGRLILDTRGDLVEARALYARHGYAETEAYNDDVYAEHWFAKRLTA
jgi:GNAT superfamily N-acetyltransferase